MEQDEKKVSELEKDSDDNTGKTDNTQNNTQLEENVQPQSKTQDGGTLTKDTAEQGETGDTGAEVKTNKFKVTLPEVLDEEQPEEMPEDNDDEFDKGQKRQKGKYRTLKAIIYSFCIVAISVILAVAVLFSVTDYLGMFRADKTADIKIPASATTDQIASILKDNGIIRSSFAFSSYVKVSKKHGIKSGTFTLNSQMSYDAIIRKLKSSGVRTVVRVTIPEGYTLQKIGELLEKKKVCTKQSFLNSADKAKISFDFQSQIPNSENRFYRLEGYLFPDTYDFFENQSSDAVVSKMLANFDSRFDSSLRQKVKASGMTVDQIVTLASIIQTEAGKTSEMGKVSSVFHNRLTKGVGGSKLLQSDATIFYATSDIEPVLSESGTQIASAYNTYKHEGLTPGAICNPGLDAIKAALSPDKTSYYFFVSDKNGKYYYAETYTEHLVNVNKALKTGKVGGTNATD